VALGSVPLVALFLIGHATSVCPPGVSASGGFDCTTSSTAAGNMACVFGLLFVVQLLLTIPLLRDEEWHYIGYGLLTMLVVGPGVALQACNALSTLPSA